MQRTENYRLFKPESTDNGSPEPFNSNADVVDTELNRLSTGLSRVDNALVSAQSVLESGITSAKVAKLDALPTSTQLDGSLSSKANKSDITNISITGKTNNTGSNILAGTLFYLNGSLCKALVDVADGATFTDGTNYNPYTIEATVRMSDYVFSNLEARQMSDSNIFANNFSVFYDWTGYLKSNITDFTNDYLIALRLPSADNSFVKMIAIDIENDTFIFNIDCIGRKISLTKRI